MWLFSANDRSECRLQRDAEQFRSKIGKIEGSGDLGDKLVELSKAKLAATSDGEKTGGSTTTATEKAENQP